MLPTPVYPLASVSAYDIAITGHGGPPTALAFHAASSRAVGIDPSEWRFAEIRGCRAGLNLSWLR